MTFRITSITAFTQIGEDDEEGVIAFLGADGMWYPLVAADGERLEAMRPHAQRIADITDRPVCERRFDAAMELGILTPRGEGS